MKRKTILKILLIMMVAISIISINIPNCFAIDPDIPGGLANETDQNVVESGAGDIDIENWKGIYQGEMPSKLTDIGGTFLGILQVAGTGIATIMLIYIGIKYITASANEKAQLKGQLTGFAIGALLLFAGSNIAAIVISTIFDIVG